MATRREWEQLATLDKLARKAASGTFRKKYLLGEIERLKKKMGIPSFDSGPSGANLDTAPNEKLPDGLSGDSDLSGDGGAAKTLFDV